MTRPSGELASKRDQETPIFCVFLFLLDSAREGRRGGAIEKGTTVELKLWSGLDMQSSKNHSVSRSVPSYSVESRAE